MDRQARLLKLIDPARQTGLEIGALCRPIVAPGSGPIAYVDHLSTLELRHKYADDPNVDINRLVDVHYVWGDKTLPEAVGDDRFDYVIASHVIEHVPDIIGWLKEIAAVLKPGGLLSLAVPDKRFTFDCLRETSSFASLVEAYLEQRRRPNFRQVLDHVCEFAPVPGQIGVGDLWSGHLSTAEVSPANQEAVFQLGEAGLRDYFQRIQAGLYIDVHCHVFTPRSFMDLLQRLAGVGLLDFRVAAYFDTAPGDIEFCLTLEKLADTLPPAARRAAICASLPTLPPEPLRNTGFAQGQVSLSVQPAEPHPQADTPLFPDQAFLRPPPGADTPATASDPAGAEPPGERPAI